MALFSFAKKLLNMRRHKPESDESAISQENIHNQYRLLSKTNSLPQNLSLLNYSDFGKGSQKQTFQESHKPRRKYQSMNAQSEHSILPIEHLFFPVTTDNKRTRKLSLKKLKHRQLKLQSDVNRSLPNVSEDTDLVTMTPNTGQYRVSQHNAVIASRQGFRLSQNTEDQEFCPKAYQLKYRESLKKVSTSLSTDQHRYRVSRNRVKTQSCDSVDSVDPVTVKLFRVDRQRKPTCDMEFIEISIE